MKEEKTTKRMNLQDLQSFLKRKTKQEAAMEKAEKLSKQEIEDFFGTIVIPAFETIKRTLAEYNLEKVQIENHNIVANLRVVEPLTNFLFKVKIDNDSRLLRIKGILKYKENLRDKLNTTLDSHSKLISFKELDKLDQKTIISFFTEWYTTKDEGIAKTKAFRAQQEKTD